MDMHLTPGMRKDIEIVLTTGPGIVTQTYIDQVLDLEKKKLGKQEVRILFSDPDVYGAAGGKATWFRFGDYGRHKMEGSWRPEMPVKCIRIGTRMMQEECDESESESERPASASKQREKEGDMCSRLKAEFESCLQTELDMAPAFDIA
jgi:hypothetical protein